MVVSDKKTFAVSFVIFLLGPFYFFNLENIMNYNFMPMNSLGNWVKPTLMD